MKTCLVLLLTLVWAAASNHCKLEQVPGLVFLACCDHADTAPHQDDDCQNDNCSTVENQLYKAERTQNSAPAPTLLFTLPLHPLLAERAPHQSANAGLPDAAPMILPRVWQFFCRTARPPRPPSFLS